MTKQNATEAVKFVRLMAEDALSQLSGDIDDLTTEQTCAIVNLRRTLTTATTAAAEALRELTQR